MCPFCFWNEKKKKLSDGQCFLSCFVVNNIKQLNHILRALWTNNRILELPESNNLDLLLHYAHFTSAKVSKRSASRSASDCHSVDSLNVQKWY